MPTNAQQVNDYLNFALLQLGAESYLHDLPIDRQSAAYRNRVIERWKYGFNDPTHPFIQQRAGAAGADAPVLPGYNRMMEAQASALFDQYEIIDHHANDATGFAATLYKSKKDGTYVLSPRSTEFRSWDLAGDGERDNAGANIQGIGLKGFAFAQLASMEDYWAHISSGERWDTVAKTWKPDVALQEFASKAQGGNALYVTGYSLSGHLATVFTLLHESVVKQTYTFNAAGHGVMTDAMGAEKDTRGQSTIIFRT